MSEIKILGAGLAGCEAALWLANQGVQVHLYEQKPLHFSPAHQKEGFAELIWTWRRCLPPAAMTGARPTT